MNCGLTQNEESICEQAMIMAGKCIMRKFKLNDKEYTVNDPSNATYKYVNYYELVTSYYQWYICSQKNKVC